MKKKNKELAIHYSCIQSVFWILAAVFMAFAVPLLKYLGFTSSEIGILMGIRAFSSIFFQPIIASISDKFPEIITIKRIIYGLIFLGILTTLVQMFTTYSFQLMIILYIFYGISLNSLSPFIDALSIQFMENNQKLNYSTARGFGSLSWAISCILIGKFTIHGPLTSLLKIQLISLVVLFFLVFTIADPRIRRIERTDNERTKQPHSPLNLLKRFPLYTFFLLATAFSFLGNNMSTSFLINTVTNLGGNNADYGILQFVLSMSELPIALLFIKILDRFGIIRIMLISFTFTSVKIFAILLAPNIPLLLMSQIFQMFGNGLFWAGSVYFIKEILPTNDFVKGQSFVGICSMGIGSGIGFLLSGKILDQFSIHVLTGLGLIISLLGLLIFLAGVHLFAGRQD